MVDWKSPNFFLALLFLIGVFGIFLMVLGERLGGDNAVFAILGYLAGWMTSIVLFFYRKKPTEGG